MLILTYTIKGSDFVETLVSENKETMLSNICDYFKLFTYAQYDFKQEDILTLIYFVLHPNVYCKHDVPRLSLGCFNFSLVITE